MKMTTELGRPDRDCEWQVHVRNDEVAILFESDEKYTDKVVALISMSPAEALRIAGLLESAGRHA